MKDEITYKTMNIIYELNGHSHELYAEYRTKQELINELDKIKDFYINKLDGEGYYSITING